MTEKQDIKECIMGFSGDEEISGDFNTNIGQKIYVHINRTTNKFNNIISVLNEHNIAGITASSINTSNIIVGCKTISPNKIDYIPVITRIDHPFGNSDVDSKISGILAAKDAGAKFVDVMIPHQFVADRNYSALMQMFNKIAEATKQKGIKIWYTLEVNYPTVNKDVVIAFCKILKSNKIKYISTSSGYFTHFNFSDNVILSRLVKKETGAVIKTYLDNENPIEAQNLIKAGIDFIEIPYSSTLGWIYDIKSYTYTDKNSLGNTEDSSGDNDIGCI